MSTSKEDLSRLLKGKEDWLMERVLAYAHAQGYTKYTSTLQEAWRMSVSGLSQSVLEALDTHDNIPELTPDEDFTEDPAARFGVIEAQRHRSRGISIGMFLGLFKYYRQSYLEMIEEAHFGRENARWCGSFLDRVFDRIELGFVSEWNKMGVEERIEELSEANRSVTNEKNKYLTIFESLAPPVILTDTEGRVENLNYAASRLFRGSHSPGSVYYGESGEHAPISWLELELAMFRDCCDENLTFEKTLQQEDGDRVFEVKFARMLDVSKKSVGITVILNEITPRKKAQAEREAVIQKLEEALEKIQTMAGLIPICAGCKKVRKDSGYWEQIETYVTEHADVQFSHGMCPECVKVYYPDIGKKTSAS